MSAKSGIPKRNVLDLRSRDAAQEGARSGPAEREQKQSLISFADKNKRKSRRMDFSFLKATQKQEEQKILEHNVQKPPKKIIQKHPSTEEQPGVSVQEKKRKKIHFSFGKNWKQVSMRPLVGFAAVAFLFALGVFSVQAYQHAQTAKGKVLGAATTAFASLEDAQAALLVQDVEQAQVSLHEASMNFSEAYDTLISIKKKFSLLSILPGVHGQLESAQHAMQAGQEISSLGMHIQSLFDLQTEEDAPGYVAFMHGYAQNSQDIKQSLDTIAFHLSSVNPEDVPESYRQTFIDLSSQFTGLKGVFSRVDSVFAALYPILGFEGQKDFLLVFQNNQELRPTGGFIGSVARVSVNDGQITQLSVPKGGSYDISGQVKEKFKAPKPMQIINPYLSFQDANWFPDFPTSAQKILDLYYDAGNEPVDGIISFTPDVLISLLELTGPVTVQDNGQIEVTSENFLRVTRESIEEKKEAESTEPKQIIAELMPKLLERALTLPAGDQLQFVSILDESIRKERIFVYGSDPALEKLVMKAGMAGELPLPDTEDYLAVVTTNIGGGKTDRVIKQHMTLTTRLTQVAAENELTIIRSHEGVASDTFSGTVNLSYMRAYVPNNTAFADAKGFYSVPANWYQPLPSDTLVDQDLQNAENNTIIHEKTGTRILEDGSYTIFGNWMRVEPTKATSSSFTYQVPNTSSDDSWALHIVRQPGQEQVSFTWVIESDRPIARVLTGTDNAHIEINGKSAEVSFDLESDTIVGIVLK